MKNSNDSLILGIDHGYGNIKTANKTFSTGVYVSDTEPAFKENLLTWNGKYYTIGEGHKEFVADKIQDMDYYVLTLAAVAYELRARGLREAKVHLAAGLPLTWLTAQKEAFRSYLLQNKEVEFSFNGIDYKVEFTGADIFPQGFAAIADRIHEFSGTNMLCDIGNGTDENDRMIWIYEFTADAVGSVTFEIIASDENGFTSESVYASADVKDVAENTPETPDDGETDTTPDNSCCFMKFISFICNFFKKLINILRTISTFVMGGITA